MKKLFGILAGIVIVLLLCSGVFADILKFLTWLFTLEYITPDTSVAGNIIVKILTFAVSYTLVGIIFNSIGLFNSKLMSFVYFIISTIIGFLLAYIVMIIEKYILVIGIILSVIFIISIVLLIVIHIKNKTNVNTR